MSVYDQWKTICSHCGGDLNVVEVTLVATGETLTMCEPLTSSGYEVPADPDLKDQSTSDEKIACADCGAAFTLGDLSLDEAEVLH